MTAPAVSSEDSSLAPAVVSFALSAAAVVSAAFSVVYLELPEPQAVIARTIEADNVAANTFLPNLTIVILPLLWVCVCLRIRMRLLHG